MLVNSLWFSLVACLTPTTPRIPSIPSDTTVTRLAPVAVRDTAPITDTLALSDTLALLTTDAVTQMTTVWMTFHTLFEDQPDSVWARTQWVESRFVSRGEHLFTVPNMVRIAQRYPSVAAALTRVGLTPMTYMIYAAAMGSANMCQLYPGKLQPGTFKDNCEFYAKHHIDILKVGYIGIRIG